MTMKIDPVHFRGRRGESFADVARRTGSINGTPIGPNATDQQVLDAFGDAASADVNEAKTAALADINGAVSAGVTSVNNAIDAAEGVLDGKITTAQTAEAGAVAAAGAAAATAAALGNILTGTSAPVRSGSVKFHDHNAHYLGSYGGLLQPTTNFGTWYGADGSWFAEIEMPQERLLMARTMQVFGNGLTGGNLIGCAWYPYGYLQDANLRGRFFFTVRLPTQGVYSAQLPVTVRRMFIYPVRTGTNWQFQIKDIDTGTIYPGTPVALADTSGISTYAGNAVSIGSYSQNANEPVPSLGASYFMGAIRRIGYVSRTVTDADFEALRLGADAITQFGGANLRWYRDLDGSAAGWAKRTGASGDTTSPCVPYGKVFAGGDITPLGKLLPRKDSDGQGYAAKPGARHARYFNPVALTNIAANDTIQVRIVTASNSEHLGWTNGVDVAAGAISGTVNVDVPITTEWCRAEFRMRSDPSKTYLDGAWISFGGSAGVFGQSQVGFFFGAVSLAYSYKGSAAASICRTGVFGGVKGQTLNRVLPGYLVGDGLIAMIEQAEVLYPGGQMYITDGIPSSGMDQWIDDSESSRLWTDTTAAFHYGKDQMSTILLPWFTFLRTWGSTTNIIFDAAIKGTGPGAKDHWLFEDGFARAGVTVVMSPGIREDAGGAGPFTYDVDAPTAAARQAVRAWITANPGFARLAPEQVVELSDEYHPPNTVPGNIELGRTLGSAFAIGMGAFDFQELTVDPASLRFGPDRLTFTIDFNAPLNRPIRNRLGATYNSGPADKTVGGIEVSTDGGITWRYIGFGNAATVGTAAITGRFRVTVTSASGAWPTGLKVRIGYGGPFAYGLSNPDGNEVARKYWIYDGDERMLNGVGNPLALSNQVYSVA